MLIDCYFGIDKNKSTVKMIFQINLFLSKKINATIVYN